MFVLKDREYGIHRLYSGHRPWLFSHGRHGRRERPAGTLSIIAYEVENSDTCIRRGCVYNIKDAAGKIVRLIRKLENKLGGSRIGKIYVGVGASRFVRLTMPCRKSLGSGTVTEEVLKELDQECRQYRPDMLDVLDIAAPVYYLDNQAETHPIGLGCSRY